MTPREWGGVVPTLAMEAHAAAIDATVDAALAEARITPRQLAAVAVTVGPGLSMCLHVRSFAGGSVVDRLLAQLP